jgi:hypothetical protein
MPHLKGRLLADAVRYAVSVAARYPVSAGKSAIVYWDAGSAEVRLDSEDAPKGAAIYAVAQRWDDSTIQVRYDGARSEFVDGRAVAC